MHPENKLTNHGKTGNGGAQSQHQNVNQGPTCNLGPKGVGAGSHGAKANQISPSNSSLKNPQGGVPPFSSLKGKVKRERSVSVDSGEQREAGTPSLDSEAKGTLLLDPQDPQHVPDQGPSLSSPVPKPRPLIFCSIYGGSPFSYPHPTHRLGHSLGSGVGWGRDFSSVGATHGGATQRDGASGQPPSSPEGRGRCSGVRSRPTHLLGTSWYPSWWEPLSRLWGLEG